MSKKRKFKLTDHELYILREIFKKMTVMETLTKEQEHLILRINFYGDKYKGDKMFGLLDPSDRKHIQGVVERNKKLGIKCSTCESPEPRLHPASQADGEVIKICQDEFHRIHD